MIIDLPPPLAECCECLLLLKESPGKGSRKRNYHKPCEHQVQGHQCKVCMEKRLCVALNQPRTPFVEQTIVRGGYFCYCCCKEALDNGGLSKVQVVQLCEKHGNLNKHCIHARRVTDCLDCKIDMKNRFSNPPGADYDARMGASFCNQCDKKKGRKCICVK